MQTNGYLRRDGAKWFVEAVNKKIYTVVGELPKPLARLNRKVSFFPHELYFLTKADSIKAKWDYYIFG